VPPPIPPSKRGTKATLHKLFVLDAQGGLAGEVPIDENCVVEYGEFLAALPESGLADGQSLFLSEWKATAIHGEHLSLVAISKGPLGPEEVSWAKAALLAAEAHLSAPADDGGEPAPPSGPDKGVMESLARALDEREAQLKERERVLDERDAVTKNALEAQRQSMDARIADLRAQLESAQAQHEEDVRTLAAEREKVRTQTEAMATAPPPAKPAVDSKLEEDRRQLETDRKYLQKYALDVIAREESVRDRETKLEEEASKLATAREELEAVRAEAEAAKAAPPAAEVEAWKREIEQRVKVLQQKAQELLAREERLRAREQRLVAAPKETS